MGSNIGLIFWTAVRNCLKYISFYWQHFCQQLLCFDVELLTKLFPSFQLHVNLQSLQPSKVTLNCGLYSQWRVLLMQCVPRLIFNIPLCVAVAASFCDHPLVKGGNIMGVVLSGWWPVLMFVHHQLSCLFQ